MNQKKKKEKESNERMWSNFKVNLHNQFAFDINGMSKGHKY